MQQKQYNPPAPPTTFTLPDSVTHNIPPETAEQFLRDAEGKILWFTVPPLDPVKPVVEGQIQGHSLAYLARREEIEERRKKRRVAREEEERKRKKERLEEREREKKEAETVLVRALGVLSGMLEAK